MIVMGAAANIRALSVAAAVLAAAAVLGPAVAHAGRSWDRAANIGDAATRLVEMHRERGSQGVLKFLDACYRTHTLSSAFKAALEACLAQDYMYARVLAQIYARLPEEARTRFNAPDAAGIERAVQYRFSKVMEQYAITGEEGEEIVRSIETHGVPVFVKGVMPPREAASSGPDATREPNDRTP